MAESLTCPHCNVTVKLRQAISAGTRVKCPKCAEKFTVPDEVEELEEQEERVPRTKPKSAAAAPRPRREEDEEERKPERKPSHQRRDEDDLEEVEEEDRVRPRRRKQGKGSGSGVLLWVMVGVVGLVVVGTGIGLGAYFLLPRDRGGDGKASNNTGTVQEAGGFTEENFGKLHRDMTEDQVTAILGQPNNSAVVTGFKRLSWQGNGAQATLQFSNGKLFSGTAQFAGKPLMIQNTPSGNQGQPTGSTLSQHLEANFSKLKYGMKEAEVIQQMGKPPVHLRGVTMGKPTATLRWSDPSGKEMATVLMTNGRLSSALWISNARTKAQISVVHESRYTKDNLEKLKASAQQGTLTRDQAIDVLGPDFDTLRNQKTSKGESATESLRWSGYKANIFLHLNGDKVLEIQGTGR